MRGLNLLKRPLILLRLVIVRKVLCIVAAEATKLPIRLDPALMLEHIVHILLRIDANCRTRAIS